MTPKVVALLELADCDRLLSIDCRRPRLGGSVRIAHGEDVADGSQGVNVGGEKMTSVATQEGCRKLIENEGQPGHANVQSRIR